MNPPLKKNTVVPLSRDHGARDVTFIARVLDETCSLIKLQFSYKMSTYLPEVSVYKNLCSSLIDMHKLCTYVQHIV